MLFEKGMSFTDAAERIGQITDTPAEQVAGFVILVITGESEGAPVISASDNIPPASAAMLLHDAGVILAQSLADAERRGGCN
jgi:hypothetical protein